MFAAFAWIGGLIVEFFGKTLSVEILKFLAYKALLLMMFFGLAVVLRSFVMEFIFDYMSAMAAKVTPLVNGMPQAPTLSLSGGVGAAAGYLKIKDCVSVLCSGYTIAFMRSLLPFG